MRARSFVLPLLLGVAQVCAAQSMEPRNAPANASSSIAATREAIQAWPSHRVVLPVTSDAEKAVLTSQVANQVGIGRRVPSAQVVHASQAIRFTVSSPPARYIRIAVELSEGEYRLTAASPSDDRPPIALDVAVANTSNLTWSPVTEGDTQDLLVERLGTPQAFDARMIQVSHLERLGFENGNTGSQKNFGDSASCQIDYKCVYDAAPAEMRAGLLAVRDSVAWMVYTKQDGNTYMCTGTLLNSANYPIPFLLTAYHCTSDVSSIASLTTFWFYRRDVCNSGLRSNTYTQLPGGAIPIALSPSLDVSLLALNQIPPPGARYGGWNAGAVSNSTTIFAAHHPAGDALKASFGTIVGSNPSPVTFSGGISFPAGTFHLVDWLAGVVEGGSSGSSVLTYDSQTGYFYSRGTLTGGSATCNTTAPRTYYGRLELFYPQISGPLTEPVTATTTTAIEYFHNRFGHYFVTAQSDEIAGLDSGVISGWVRSGQSWKVWTAGPGKADVCRFFTTFFAPKSSHFYTASATECAGVKQNPVWQYEKLAFKVALPVNGVCAAGSSPLYRLYNSGGTGAPNHRYTTSATIRANMLVSGFVLESDNTVCVPN